MERPYLTLEGVGSGRWADGEGACWEAGDSVVPRPAPWRGYSTHWVRGRHTEGLAAIFTEDLGAWPLRVKGVTPISLGPSFGFGRVWAFEVLSVLVFWF